MSPSEPVLVKLTVQAEPGTEIFLIDHSFSLRARGVGRLSEEVTPGLYRVKLRAGRLVQELHQAVRPGSGDVFVRAPQMAFGSAAPLTATAKTDRVSEMAAASLSQRAHERTGEGSQLFVFARRHDTDQPPSAGHPGRGLSLRAGDGRLLVDFESAGESDLDAADPWTGATIDVDPGAYRLRVDTPRWGAMERTVVACPGWQTQVFLLQTDYGVGPPELRADLASAAALMAEHGGFDPASQAARRVELARTALVSGRSTVSADELRSEAEANPMLGILGAHALLLSADPDLSAVAEVVERLLPRIGAHPDLDALRLGLGHDIREIGVTFQQPPMLTSSWGQAVAASWKHPELIPDGSLAARVATWLWGYGPWLIWLADGVEDQPRENPAGTLDEALARVTDLAQRAAPPLGLTDAEAALLAQVRRPSAAPPPSFDLAPGAESTPGAPPSPDDSLAQALGLPPAAVKTVATSLAVKLTSS